jgi:hypothetical protein
MAVIAQQPRPLLDGGLIEPGRMERLGHVGGGLGKTSPQPITHRQVKSVCHN